MIENHDLLGRLQLDCRPSPSCSQVYPARGTRCSLSPKKPVTLSSVAPRWLALARSHRANVPGSTPRAAAASFCESPSDVRCRTSCSPMVRNDGWHAPDVRVYCICLPEEDAWFADTDQLYRCGSLQSITGGRLGAWRAASRGNPTCGAALSGACSSTAAQPSLRGDGRHHRSSASRADCPGIAFTPCTAAETPMPGSRRAS